MIDIRGDVEFFYNDFGNTLLVDDKKNLTLIIQN